MKLLVVHRWLIAVFAVFSVGFGVWALVRYGRTAETVALASGIGSILVALGCMLYLFKAPHLKR